MGWVNDARRELAGGRIVLVYPTGGSMRGRVESGKPFALDLQRAETLLAELGGTW